MLVRFKDSQLEQLETDSALDGKYATGIGSMFRRRMQQIRAAADERDFYALKSLRFEKLKGDRQHQRSMRLNDQWRLVMELQDDAAGKTVFLISIEDYH